MSWALVSLLLSVFSCVLLSRLFHSQSACSLGSADRDWNPTVRFSVPHTQRREEKLCFLHLSLIDLHWPEAGHVPPPPRTNHCGQGVARICWLDDPRSSRASLLEFTSWEQCELSILGVRDSPSKIRVLWPQGGKINTGWHKQTSTELSPKKDH